MVFPIFHLPIIIIIFFITLFLGVLLFLKERRSATNKSFFILALSIVFWIITLYISDHPTFASQALFWNRVTVACGFLIGLFLLCLVLVFPAKKISISPFWKIFLTISGIISVLCLFTNFIVKDVEFYPWGVNIIGGKLFFLSVIWSILNIGAQIWVSVRKLKKSIGLERAQFKFLMAGIFLFFITGLTFNMILPAITGTNEYAKYGSYFTLLYIIPIAAGIVKYHLFNIKVILTELLVGLIAILLFVLPFLMPSFVLKVLTVIVFLLFSIFGYYLIKATHKEIKYREEIQRAYEIEKKAKEELEHLDKAKNQFILATQHHLRTPLSIIKGYISSLLNEIYGKIENERIKQVLENTLSSNQRLITLVNEFLDISQYQLGKGFLKKESINLCDVLNEVIEELKPEAKRKGLYLQLITNNLQLTTNNLQLTTNNLQLTTDNLAKKAETEKPSFIINADFQKLKEAVFNIVDNAIKYTFKGGVTIEIKNLPRTVPTSSGLVRGQISPKQSLRDATGQAKIKNTVIIEIKDTGIGMEKEEIKKLFQGLFERGKEAERIYTTGRGIGLYISHGIIEAHQGRIWAESKGKGRGSTFFIELPRR